MHEEDDSAQAASGSKDGEAHEAKDTKMNDDSKTKRL